MALKEYLYTQVAQRQLSVADAKQYLRELSSASGPHDIAVIGMAGRFPEAPDLAAYWDNLRAGRASIRDLPDSRKPNALDFIRRFHQDDLRREGRINPDGSLRIDFARRGYLDQIDHFDAAFFGIGPREAAAMDPNQRVFLEVAYAALEDAGYGGRRIHGRQVGTFVGIDHVEEHKYKRLAAMDPLVATGTWPGILASRLAYLFDLRGPSMVIDTACSSGLVSVHQAARALRQQECELAIAGGLSSFYYEATTFASEQRELESIESPDDTVRTFDRRAKGTTWGEGIGVVLLKPLEAALRDGDRIHAVIRGSAVNNDGASNGITAPNADAQEQLLLSAWQDAQVDPRSITYVEAHGTGTVLGDPIEVRALTNAFRRHTPDRQFCGLGSVKPNIGHLVGASGMASLLKVILMLEHGEFVPSVNIDDPNGFIDFVGSPAYVCDRAAAWSDAPGGVRRAGVNSFGFSGTNAHVVLEQPPAQASTEDVRAAYIVTVSARTPELLRELLRATAGHLASAAELSLSALSFTSTVGRGHYEHRVAIRASTAAELVDALAALAAASAGAPDPAGVWRGECRIVSERKQAIAPGELTETTRRQLSARAEQAVTVALADASGHGLDAVCELYVAGAEVPWGRLVDGIPVRSAALPVYPFEPAACWYRGEAAEPAVASPEGEPNAAPALGALLGARALSTPDTDYYTAGLSSARDWILTDHVILGQHIVPGTTYVELALEVAREYWPGPVTLHDMGYAEPCVVEADSSCRIQIAATRTTQGLELVFTSFADGRWRRHAECTVSPGAGAAERRDLDDLRAELDGAAPPRFDLNPRESVIELGARWANEQIVAAADRTAVVQLSLAEPMHPDLVGAVFHVAMFDNAVNAISQKVGEGLYLPYFYREIQCLAPMPTSFHSVITVRPERRDGVSVGDGDGGGDQETITFDVDLVAPDGQVFARVRDYSIKRVDDRSAAVIRSAGGAPHYYRLAPVPTLAALEAQAPPVGHIVLLSSGTPAAVALAGALSALDPGLCVIEPRLDGSGQAVWTQVGPALDRALADGPTHVVDAASWGRDDDPETTLLGHFAVLKAIVARTVPGTLRLCAVADHVYGVGDAVVVPTHRALAAMLAAVAHEDPDLECLVLDLDPGDDPRGAAARVVEQATLGSYRYDRTWWQGSWYEQQLEDVVPSADPDSPLLRRDGVYLVTGGTGDLGLEVARWLASRERVGIALVGRTDWADPAVAGTPHGLKVQEFLAAIAASESGAQVHAGDVADRARMTEILRDVRRDLGEVRGIFHCAGLAGEGLAISKPLATFAATVRPKVGGLGVIDDLTGSGEVDLVVLFSSVLALFGDIGQTDYMAANAYLDAASLRRHGRTRFVSINWPAWAEVGMAVRFGVTSQTNTVAPLSTVEALRCLDELLGSGLTSVLPGRLDVQEVGRRQDRLRFRLSPTLQHAVDDRLRLAASTGARSTGGGSALVMREEYTATERQLLVIWADVLAVPTLDLFDTFSDLGGQSFLAIQLYKAINRVFPGLIEVADVYSFPTVEQMAAQIDRKSSAHTEPRPAQPAAGTTENGGATVEISDLINQVKAGRTSIEDAVRIMRGKE